jgi:hypothetical protein
MFTGDFSYGGEWGIRTPGTGFSPYNGLANSRFHCLLFGINDLQSGEMLLFGPETPAGQLLCNYCATKKYSGLRRFRSASARRFGLPRRLLWRILGMR